MPDQPTQISKKEAAATQTFVEVKEIRDGSVFLKGGGLRKVIAVSGVNFQLKSEEEKTLLINAFQGLLNSLDFRIQIVVHTRKVNVDNYLKNLSDLEAKEENPLLKTEIAEYREFSRALVAENPIMNKSFFVVVPYDPIVIPAGGMISSILPFKKAKSELAEKKTKEDIRHNLSQLSRRVEGILNSITSMGMQAVVLNDEELVELFYNLYNPALTEKKFETQILPEQVADIIAPSAIEINPNYVKIGDYFAKTIFVSSLSRYLATGWLDSLINFPDLVDISIFVHPVETPLALKTLRRKVAEIEAELSEREEKGYVRDPALETAYQDIETLRDELLQGTQKLFKTGIYVTFYAATIEDLNGLEAKIVNEFESKMAYSKQAVFQQMDGFISVLPLAQDKLLVHNQLNTAPISSMFPFTSLTLSDDKGIMYGLNRHNNTLVIFDRFSLENYNTTIFATSGAGKSYTAKLEALRLMSLGADVIIIDPENEYEALANTVGGSMFKISLASQNHINPFDIPPVPRGEDPAEILKSHIANLTGLMRIMLGNLTATEVNILDRAITETYAAHDIVVGRDFSKAAPPLLQDLETVLDGMEGGRTLAERLYRFTKGSYAGFTNMPTNLEVKNRLIVFSIRDLEEELRPIAMYVILNFLWHIVRSEFKKRIVIIDEAWWMMKYEDAASFLFALVKRARKYYLGITTITQDIEDFLGSPYGRPIINNSSIKILLKQAPTLVDLVVKSFYLTDVEKNILLDARPGEGLFIAGQTHVAVQILASYYENSIITTKPEEILERKE